MINFLIRRLLTSTVVVLVSSFIMYLLVAKAIDPLAILRGSSSMNKQAQMDALTAQLHLNDSVFSRYFDWLKGAAGCVYGQCDLGSNWATHQKVTDMLSGAILTTLQLVAVATVIAIVVGAAIGIVSALRQYSGFDYSITFMSFLLYSLPVFWVAVWLKASLAIQFNDFITAGGQFSVPWIVGTAVVAGLVIAGAVGGDRKRRGKAGGITGLAVAGLMIYANLTNFFITPSTGGPLDLLRVAVLGAGIAVGITSLSTGLRNRKALYTSLSVAGVGVALYYPLLLLWNGVSASWLLIIALAIVAAGVGIGVGYAWGGLDRSRSARTGALTALGVGAILFLDRVAQSWQTYTNDWAPHGRPVATNGQGIPNIQGSFWIHTTDLFTHILLPSVALVLVSMASYTRYTRASTLEVLNQDYIRTARAKGLTERTVIMRHAFRNALLPLASVVPVDLLLILGGALITEHVFGWAGMGNLFVTNMASNQQDVVMGYIVVVALFAIVANILADLLYSILDPRIRVNA